MFIESGRRSGKTTKLVQYSARTGKYILVRDFSEVENIIKIARDLDLNIPFPITISEIKKGQLRGSSIYREGILVDNAVSVLQDLLEIRIIGATTLTELPVSNPPKLWK
ncbi:replicase [Enterococcus casseliflavus]|uniref:replicase n=1 Tax=Enterococcus casseliflavus TaxID=37734 RepID=UPI001CBBD017|nr:replicase [Enterococcus casseliflavus]MBZ3641243.1 replicase [Enterococcus casseliflavus]